MLKPVYVAFAPELDVRARYHVPFFVDIQWTIAQRASRADHLCIGCVCVEADVGRVGVRKWTCQIVFGRRTGPIHSGAHASHWNQLELSFVLLIERTAHSHIPYEALDVFLIVSLATQESCHHNQNHSEDHVTESEQEVDSLHSKDRLAGTMPKVGTVAVSVDVFGIPCCGSRTYISGNRVQVLQRPRGPPS